MIDDPRTEARQAASRSHLDGTLQLAAHHGLEEEGVEPGVGRPRAVPDGTAELVVDRQLRPVGVDVGEGAQQRLGERRPAVEGVQQRRETAQVLELLARVLLEREEVAGDLVHHFGLLPHRVPTDDPARDGVGRPGGDEHRRHEPGQEHEEDLRADRESEVPRRLSHPGRVS